MFPLNICGSGSCVKAVYRWFAGQKLCREVQERQARFKYLGGSDRAELSNPSIWEDPSKASLSHSSLHHFTLFFPLPLRRSLRHLSILFPNQIFPIYHQLFISSFFSHSLFIPSATQFVILYHYWWLVVEDDNKLLTGTRASSLNDHESKKLYQKIIIDKEIIHRARETSCLSSLLNGRLIMRSDGTVQVDYPLDNHPPVKREKPASLFLDPSGVSTCYSCKLQEQAGLDGTSVPHTLTFYKNLTITMPFCSMIWGC